MIGPAARLRLDSVAPLGLALLGIGAFACQQPMPAASPPAQDKAPPQEAAARDSLELKRMCAEHGQRRVAEDQKGLAPGIGPINPKYCYSKTLNTCIYSGGFVGKGSLSLAVTDLLTNEDILTSVTAGGRTLELTQQEYRVKEKELFAACIP